MKRFLLACAGIIGLMSACSSPKTIEVDTELYHGSVDRVTEIMIHDIFSPTRASRVFVYPNIAAYEVLAACSRDGHKSLAGQLNELTPVPRPDSLLVINPNLAALVAHIEVSRGLVFTETELVHYRDSLYKIWEDTNREEFQVSRDYGLEVADFIKNWMDEDNYKKTVTMPKFSVDEGDPSRWQPTPPAYMDGIDPHWNKVRTLVIDSAQQFKPIPPPPFSMHPDSLFFKEVKEVYDISLEITKKGDESEEIAIAQFWDCNPYVSVNRGHLMFATKKITPGAHWIGITKIASRKAGLDFLETVRAYTQTSIAIFDGFISCWDEKYRSNLVRPETLIQQYFDDQWKPILQTPPFPEYTSGHSVISGAAGVALTDLFGEDFAFDDDTEVPYGLPVRSFTSFDQASAEAAISRMYGGIHYRQAVEVGVTQGRDLGNYVIEKLEW